MKNIWISGSINSGKSTVAKILGKELKMAVIELDTFSIFVENFLNFKEYLKLNYEIFSEIVEIYNKKNIGVIIVYPLGETNYLENKNKLENFEIFSIDPTLGVALTNRGDRKLTDWERERVQYHYDIKIHSPSFGIRVDAQNKAPQEISKEIIRIYEN